MKYTWSRGKQLESVTEGENKYSYTYNIDGIRTSKTVNGETIKINTVGGRVVSQCDSKYTRKLHFQYKGDTPFGFTINDVQYIYITNLNGDIVGITDTDGNLIAKYSYDEWGKLLSITADSDENYAIAEMNPLRYRGYYYDNETGYYYLQSRYYDPSICRFINLDVPEIANMSKDIPVGTNLFAYCNNNPINLSDKSGLWVWLMDGWKRTWNGFDVNMDKKFLSRPFCSWFAKLVIYHYGNGRTYKNMNRHRIEVELWAHAIGYYAGKILNRVNKK